MPGMVVRKGGNPSILRYGHLQPGPRQLKVLPHQYLTPDAEEWLERTVLRMRQWLKYNLWYYKRMVSLILVSNMRNILHMASNHFP